MSRTVVIPQLIKGLKRGVEIGVYRGKFSREILSQWDGHLILVDAWRKLDSYIDITNETDHEGNYEATREAVAPYKDRVTILRMLSEEAAAIVPDQSLDFIYIDANHAYDVVKKDLHLWWPKLKPGGLFSGHDYVNGTFPEGVFGVKQAVDEFLAGYVVNVIQSTWPSWWVYKRNVLEEANALVTGDRAKSYAPAEIQFPRIAQAWSAVLGIEVNAKQVCECMIALKLIRLAMSPSHRDSLVDIPGYSAIREVV